MQREKEAAAKKAAAKPAAASSPKPGAAVASNTNRALTGSNKGSLRGNAELDRFKAEMVQAMREELDAWKAALIEEIRNM